eukprot:355754-Chlamydomonas_euryale.AAC.16
MRRKWVFCTRADEVHACWLEVWLHVATCGYTEATDSGRQCHSDFALPQSFYTELSCTDPIINLIEMQLNSDARLFCSRLC